MTPQQINMTIDDVRAQLDGDPLDVVHVYRGHIAIVLAALDEARAERDAARAEAQRARAEHVETLRDYAAEMAAEGGVTRARELRAMADRIERGEHKGGEGA